MPDTADSLESFARFYRTSTATVCRWRQAGVDLSDPLAVAIRLAGSQHPSPSAIQATTEMLTEELSNL